MPVPSSCIPATEPAFPNTKPLIETGTFGRCPPQFFAVLDVNSDHVLLGWLTPTPLEDTLIISDPDNGTALAGIPPEQVVAHKRSVLGFILHRDDPGLTPDGTQLGEGNVLADEDIIGPVEVQYEDLAVIGGTTYAYLIATVMDNAFFNPAVDIPNLAVWLDAQDHNTVIHDGSNNVITWQSKDASKLEFTQATPGSRPVTAASINGRNAIDFPGSHWLRTTAAVLSGTRGSVFAVFQANVATSGVWLASTGAATTESFSTGVIGDSGGSMDPRLRIRGAPSGNLDVDSLDPGIPASTTPTVVEIHSDGSSFEIRVNGVVYPLTFTNGSDTGEWAGDIVAALTNITVGAVVITGGASSSEVDGKIGEVIVVDGALLNGAFKRAIRQYLGDRWGIAVV